MSLAYPSTARPSSVTFISLRTTLPSAMIGGTPQSYYIAFKQDFKKGVYLS